MFLYHLEKFSPDKCLKNYSPITDQIISSWHEIGKYDIPAMIDYIINKTNQQKIHYIGHSQGTTTLFVAMSVRPEYNQKVRLATLMGPAVFLGKIPHVLLRIISKFVDQIEVYKMIEKH